MLDLNFIRNNPDKVKQAIANKHENAANVDQILEIDAQRRSMLHACEQLKSKRNEKSKEVSELKKKGQDASRIIEETKKIGDDIKSFEEKLNELEPQINNLLLRIPNIPAADVPIGKDEKDNVVVRSWGQRKTFDFTPLPHWELGSILNILDLERSSKITGSGFILLKGLGAKLERALFSFMLDIHTREHGYTELFPPFLVNRASMTGTGQLPKLEEDMYRTAADDLFLVPTAEVPVTNIYRDTIVKLEELPIKMTAYSPCFRREAGSFGKDVRGLNRVHQFEKVEIIQIVEPEKSYAVLEEMVAHVEKLLQALQLPYRILLLCGGDMGFTSALTYDFEVFSAAQERWLEVSSVSNFESYQTNRMKCRYKDADGKMQLTHSLNGSSLALPRIVACLLENNQTADGIALPEVLHAYFGKSMIS